ncbi:MAG: DUF7383 domain-containing protein [Halovenus sp.]
MTDRRRSNHARIAMLEQLGPQEDPELPWATFGGDRTDAYTFSVSTAEAADAYIELQLYDVGTYGHEILLNGDPLGGFDLPPANGWQHWMDMINGAALVAGENTVRIRRDTDDRDSFAVGAVVVTWTEPVG